MNTQRQGWKFLKRKCLIVKEKNGEDVLEIHAVVSTVTNFSDSIKCREFVDWKSSC
jgi:hypothetical protein